MGLFDVLWLVPWELIFWMDFVYGRQTRKFRGVPGGLYVMLTASLLLSLCIFETKHPSVVLIGVGLFFLSACVERWRVQKYLINEDAVEALKRYRGGR